MKRRKGKEEKRGRRRRKGKEEEEGEKMDEGDDEDEVMVQMRCDARQDETGQDEVRTQD